MDNLILFFMRYPVPTTVCLVLIILLCMAAAGKLRRMQ